MEEVSDEDFESLLWLAERQEDEDVLVDAFFEWKHWAWFTSTIISCLSASRPLILFAAAKRVATENRGIAILAAMKISNYDGVFGDERGLAPGALPINLVNKVIQAEGRIVFDSLHYPTSVNVEKRFFSDVIPTTAAWIPSESYKKSFQVLPAENWNLDNDGALHISPGSVMQRFCPRDHTMAYVVLNSSKSSGQIKANSLRKFVANEYRVWRNDVQSTSGSMSRFPHDIRILFLPLAFGDTDDPLMVTGIVLAANSKACKHQLLTWYKCGTYMAETLTLYTLRHEIVVGKV